MVVLNKTDLVDPERLAEVRAEVEASLNRAVKLVDASFARIDARILLGLEAAAEDDLDARPSHHDGIDGEHDHDDFDSFSLTLGPVADPAALEARIVAAVEAHGILRVKGFLDIPGKAMRHVVQAVGARVQRYYDRPWRTGEERASRLVVIGESGLDQAAITAALGA